MVGGLFFVVQVERKGNFSGYFPNVFPRYDSRISKRGKNKGNNCNSQESNGNKGINQFASFIKEVPRKCEVKGGEQDNAAPIAGRHRVVRRGASHQQAIEEELVFARPDLVDSCKGRPLAQNEREFLGSSHGNIKQNY